MRARSKAGTGTTATCHDGHAIGLDIGSSSVRAAVLAVKQRHGEPTVEARAIAGVPLAPGIVVGGVVADRDALTAALGQLWSAHRIKCRNVILGVANPQLLVRELELPDLDPAQRAKALPFQARELTAMPLDQMVLDFAPLGPPDPQSRMQPGLLVACPREPVLAAIAAVEGAGLRVVRVDLASLALLRAVADGRYDVEVVIDLGAHLTTVVVHQHGVPRLVRTLARGGAELTARLADQLGIDQEQAETAKMRADLAESDPVAQALRDLVAPLLAEIRSSLNYFRTGHPGAQIQRVALTGGGGNLAGLPQLLVDQLGIACEVVRPDRLLVPPARAKRPPDLRHWASALSVGLAIGGRGVSSDLDLLTARPVTPWTARPGWGISVDLLPGEVLESRRSRVYLRLVAVGLVLVVLLCGALVLTSYADRSSAQRSDDDAQSRTTQLTAAAKQYADITVATDVLKQTQAQAGALMGQDVDVVNLIARIRHSLPETVTISNLAVLLAPPDQGVAETTSGGHTVIGTVTISGTGSQIKDVAPFVANLNHLRGVVAVVPGSTTQTAEGMSYSLSLSFTDVLYTHRFDQAATP